MPFTGQQITEPLQRGEPPVHELGELSVQPWIHPLPPQVSHLGQQ